jgi:hypothetical protein
VPAFLAGYDPDAGLALRIRPVPGEPKPGALLPQ